MPKISMGTRLAGLLMAVLVTGCTVPAPLPSTAPATARPEATAPAQAGSTTVAAKDATAAAVPFVGKLAVEPKNGAIGTAFTITGSGLPASKDLRLEWTTVTGSWTLKGAFQEEFHGRDFAEKIIPLGMVKTDASGDLKSTFKVPPGFGFDHNINLVDPVTNKALNRTNFFVNMQVKMLNNSGPVGTPIHFEVEGSGFKSYENSWMLLYDNKVTGWIASVLSEGRAKFSIPATGAVGPHTIQVNHGWASVDYLNWEQTPAAGQRSWTFTFNITPGDPVLPAPAETQGLKPEVGVAPPGTASALWTDLASGPIHTPVRLQGRGLPPGTDVDIAWWRMVGNRVAGKWNEVSTTVGKATVAADGTISLNFKVPEDLGGDHRIEARAGDKVLATGKFTVTPSVVAVRPAKVKAGEFFTVQIKGVGWTETANIYTLTYDNAYLGFGCGFSSQGDVTINLPATGGPGWHFIDLYPAIYKGADMKGTVNFRTPMLTGDVEHPHEKLPIFHLAVYITE